MQTKPQQRASYSPSVVEVIVQTTQLSFALGTAYLKTVFPEKPHIPEHGHYEC